MTQRDRTPDSLVGAVIFENLPQHAGFFDKLGKQPGLGVNKLCVVFPSTKSGEPSLVGEGGSRNRKLRCLFIATSSRQYHMDSRALSQNRL